MCITLAIPLDITRWTFWRVIRWRDLISHDLHVLVLRLVARINISSLRKTKTSSELWSRPEIDAGRGTSSINGLMGPPTYEVHDDRM